MKIIVPSYTFNAAAKTITFPTTVGGVPLVPVIERILLITDQTLNTIIYDPSMSGKGGSLSGQVLTLAFDTSTGGYANGDNLQIFYDDGNYSGVPSANTEFRSEVALQPQRLFRTTFARVIASGVDSAFFSVIGSIGTGQTVSQSAGNLVITAGTTANAETILRSTQSFTGHHNVRWQTILSQRNAQNNFVIELVDVIGDGLTLNTTVSATQMTVTIPNNPFTSENVGQFISVGAISGVAGIPGRYVIASVAGNVVTFTVAGWPTTGSGTCTLYGWNFHRCSYTGTTATAMDYDAGRRGWASGNSGLTILTTAAPGHLAMMTCEDGNAAVLDQLIASSGTIQTTARGSRVVNLPEESTPLFLQIRTTNATSAPTATTWTIGMVSVENYASQNVSINRVAPQPFQSAMPMSVVNQPSVSIVNGTVTTVSTVTSVASSVDGSPSRTTDVPSAALTTLGLTNTAANSGQGSSIVVNVIVTAVSGTNPTLDVDIEESDDTGTNWYKVYSFPRITATGQYRSPRVRINGDRWRYAQNVGGTSPSFTRAIGRLPCTGSADAIRQVIDRTIAPNTGGSTTPVLLLPDCRNMQMVVNMGAITTTAPVFQLEGSDDFGVTWYAIGSTLTGVASSTVQITFNNVNAERIRARVSTAGSGATLGWVLLKGF